MSIQLVAFAFGCFLLMVTILGGGFEIKEIKVPKVGGASRLAACLAGALFLCGGIRPALVTSMLERGIGGAGGAGVEGAERVERVEAGAVAQAPTTPATPAVTAVQASLTSRASAETSRPVKVSAAKEQKTETSSRETGKRGGFKQRMKDKWQRIKKEAAR